MTYRLTIPSNMSFQDWADVVVQDLEAEGLVPINKGEDQWQPWAISLSQVPLVAGRNPPNPIQYKNWKDWAERFIGAIY